MDGISLTASQQRELECQLDQTTDARVYRRTFAVLEVSRGAAVADVAQMLGVTRQSVYNWIDAYRRSYRPQALIYPPRSGRPSVWTGNLEGLLRTLMQTSPDLLGYYAVNWTVPLIQNYLHEKPGQQISENSIRRELGRLKYVWKRSRYVLKPDPEAPKKTPNPAKNRHFATAKRVARRG